MRAPWRGSVEGSAVREVAGPSEHETSFRVLSDVARLLVSETDLARVLDAVAHAVGSLIPYDSLIAYEADHDLHVLRPVQVVDPNAKEIYLHICRFGEGISGEVAVRREAILVNDAHLDPRALQIEGTPAEEECLISVPLLARGELKGVLNLYRTGNGMTAFTHTELLLAERFGELAALAMDNAQIRARLQAESVVDRLTGLYNHRHFQERLAEELQRSHVSGLPVSLILVDIDQFQRVNDAEGHLAGDRVLAAVASLTKGSVRPGDLVCRVGGEEFAVLMPATGAEEAAGLAEVIRGRIADEAPSPPSVPITASIGVAEGPAHGTEGRELLASANYALLQAKTAGRNRVSVFLAGEWSGVRAVPMGEARLVGHLKLLQSVSSKLNRLQDVRQIAHTIIDELGDLIEFHNCRIHLLDSAGQTLYPVAFHGMLTEYEGETEELLITALGEGITGRVALTGESIYAADANNCEFAQHIPGTPVIDESILAVPLKFDERVIGTIVLSKLELNQFDADDLRLLESLASAAAVAFQNARLFSEERQSAETSNALLRVSQALTRTRDPERVLREVVGSMSDLLDVARVSAWVRDSGGGFVPKAFVGFHPSEMDRTRALRVGPEVAERYLYSMEEPFFLPAEVVGELPEELRMAPEARPVVIAPFRWEPDGFGTLVAIARDASRVFSPRDFRMAGGVADLASLAMGNASRFADLEHAFLQTVEVLANALEAKDEYTSGHAREVAEIAVAVGREFGMDAEDLQMLELAGMFHDIGKIGVGTDIINKPGPLTDEEMKEMQRHPEIGARILAPVEFLQPVLPIIHSGHERWDGGGYPDGLAGEDIPLGARIIFVCDAFHAMTSDRSYRKALPVVEAIRRLEEASGTQFDPSVVRVFVEAHERGLIHHHA
jgi:diguanylate cyclase (GGDEF)-like protein